MSDEQAADVTTGLSEAIEAEWFNGNITEALTFASDDGTEYEHNGHGPNEGEPECPGCWAASIRAALAAAPTESES